MGAPRQRAAPKALPRDAHEFERVRRALRDKCLAHIEKDRAARRSASVARLRGTDWFEDTVQEAVTSFEGDWDAEVRESFYGRIWGFC